MKYEWSGKRGMKYFAKKVGLENSAVQGPEIFKRAGVGIHMVLPLEKVKSNSVVLSITHSQILQKSIKTVNCDFSALSTYIEDKIYPILKKDESMALLTIVSNNTFVKSWKKLCDLKYRTGLINTNEREILKVKLLLKAKLTYISNRYSSKETYILYQTKYKTELVALSNKERLVELIGLEVYERCFDPLIKLGDSIGESKAPIADILKNKIDKDGIGSVMEILKKIDL